MKESDVRAVFERRIDSDELMHKWQDFWSWYWSTRSGRTRNNVWRVLEMISGKEDKTARIEIVERLIPGKVRSIKALERILEILVHARIIEKSGMVELTPRASPNKRKLNVYYSPGPYFPTAFLEFRKMVHPTGKDWEDDKAKGTLKTLADKGIYVWK
jgi:hypothetical protein